MSVGFLLQSQNDAIIWRGPLKSKLINQFLNQVNWGNLDYLIIDSPPGTGDEPLSVCQNIDRLDGAVIVTTPQHISEVDVRKSISFCRKMNVRVIGVIENMSGFICPNCGASIPILLSGGGIRIAESMKVPFLGSIPIDSRIAESCDNGVAFISYFYDSETAAIMREIIRPITALEESTGSTTIQDSLRKKKNHTIRIAIPVENGSLARNLKHTKSFAVMDVDEETGGIAERYTVDAPQFQSGMLPSWLAKREVGLIITGEIGEHITGLFNNQGIRVITGRVALSPEELVGGYMAGILEAGKEKFSK